MAAPILKQGDTLIATVLAALSDADLLRLRDDLVARVGQVRARSVIIDITALDVMDSFATRTLRGVAEAVRLRGARAIVVGVQPDVAMTMVQLGLDLGRIETALDLEEGLELLAADRNRGGGG